MIARRVLSPMLLSLAAVSLVGQEQEDPLVFGTETELVTVPVFVVDGEGNALRGLHREDFRLWENKDEMELVSFQYIDTTSDEAQEEIMEAPAARRRFMFLFDLSFTSPFGLNNAQASAKRLVQTGLAESDLGAVATYDSNRGLRVLQNFTSDRPSLSHAINHLGVANVATVIDPLALFDSALVPDQVAAGGAGAGGDTAQSLAANQVLEVFARQMRDADQASYRAQIMSLMQGFEDLAGALRQVEGRKQIIYFSTGFDTRELTGARGPEQDAANLSLAGGRIWEVDGLSRYGDTRLRRVFADATKTLANSDTLVHAVDITGLEGPDIRQAGSSTGAYYQNGRDALHFIANETGGRLFKDTNDFSRALGEVMDMTSRFYVLGYQPKAKKGPGEFHKIKVKVARKGAKVSHRAGYYERVERSQQTVLQRQFESAQLVMTGAGPNNLSFDALVLPFPKADGKQTLGIVLQVPRRELRWDRGAMSLEVFGYVVDKEGTIRDHIAQMVRIDPAVADPDGSALGVSFFGTFDVEAGDYTVKLMIQEPDTDAAGVQFIDLTVPPYDSRRGFLLPPVVVDDMASWLGLAINPERESMKSFPFTMGGERFLPRTSFEVRPGMPEKLVLISYQPDRPLDPAAPLTIHSSVTNAAGEFVPGGTMQLAGVEYNAGHRTYILDYTPDDLEPGDYTLRIGVGEAGVGQVESYARLRIGSDD